MSIQDTTEPRLIPTRCAICESEGNATERYPANFDPSAFSTDVFSARRLPDRVHYRMVDCDHCGLLRSDPVLDATSLERLYRTSTFDYDDEVDALKITYGRAIERLETIAPSKRGLLDIGTGNGFVLEQAIAQGWTDVRGVEPSVDAIAKAAPGIGGRIVEDVMRPGLFEPSTFDGITIFQVLDHIPEPAVLLEECRKVLRPGAGVLAFNHNVEAVSARLLRNRSPIVDIEHTYLYTPSTMTQLFAKAGFTDIQVTPVRNTYSVAYLMQLVPVSRGFKKRFLPLARRSVLASWRVTVPLGNLCLTARAPRGAG